MKFHFRTADGHTCCRTDHVELLCPRCKEIACSGKRETPDIPTLIDRMRSARGLPQLEVKEGSPRFSHSKAQSAV